MPAIIREFIADDAGILAKITKAAINDIASAAYNPDQIDAWVARHPCPNRFLKRWIDGALIWVALDDCGEPIAYCLMEYDGDNRGHLDMLYCHPDHAGSGMAGALLKMADHRAKEDGIISLYTKASELARRPFERAGYTVKHRRDFEIGGVPIHNYAMEKRLD